MTISNLMLAMVEDSLGNNPALCRLALTFLSEQLFQMSPLSLSSSSDLPASDVSVQALDKVQGFLYSLSTRDDMDVDFVKTSLELLVNLARARGVSFFLLPPLPITVVE